ncbi:MAG: two-component system sensor histidine kinase NtrB [Planctomycetota bacterium]
MTTSRSAREHLDSWLLVGLGLFGCTLIVAAAFVAPRVSTLAATVVGSVLAVLWLLVVAVAAFLVRPSPNRKLQLPTPAAAASDARRRILDTLPDLLVLLDASGRIAETNAALEKLLQRSGESLRGTHWLAEFVPEIDRADLQRLFDQMLSHRDVTRITSPLKTPGGTFQIEWHNQTLRNGKGRAVGVLAIGRDVTEARRVQQQAVQSERLAAIGQMVAGLAHESGNALQRSQACLEMLELRLRDQPELLDLVYRIQIAQDRLNHLHEELQGYAAPIVLEREPVSVRQVIDTVWQQLEPMWQGRQTSLTLLPTDDNSNCRADPRALESVFRNILENALEAATDPVEIEIRCATCEESHRRFVQVTIRDNGCGLDEEARVRIFQPFFTTKPQGTGLGMSITRRLVESHGGEISAATAAGGGTVITVKLPEE